MQICVSACSILQRTIQAAVEQHFLDLQNSIDQDLSNYESQGPSCQAGLG